ncbi:hypothetical protein CC80DRAFT_594675 [Byssothecium circinans]|uniref:DUF7932 domain-containing protein n=1 Tax=Byssothecium circinans TaxID=147558 RepID=A0A6A5TTR7_9PLEO|nr:hypothetical protein CC80DRAFT_594675 [Byssothecium circinans]
MNPQRPQLAIQVNGGDGESGYTTYSWSPDAAPKYQHGVDGRSARRPGGGGPGGFLSVMLSPSRSCAGGIHVEGIGSWQGQDWEVPPGHDLLVSARGGHGGNGGIGENGQDGGRGRDGNDATRYSQATAGHRGKNGGSGGYGSSGANGGDGGTIEVSVREEDMNLLIAVLWTVKGGNGGARGAHGRGGRGGKGGKGGAGYEWSIDIHRVRIVENSAGHHVPETYVETEYYSNPPGWNGSSGYNGSQPSEPLYDGAPGRDGLFSFFVLRSNGPREQYHGCYDLRVSGFDIMDENDDGINEPGEHIFVKNIRVQNTGAMPSPPFTSIPLNIVPSTWLDGNVVQDGITLPTGIPLGGSYEARGFMKLFVKQEPGRRASPGCPLIANDTVKIIAVMPGINRTLDNFLIQSPIVVRYPLELLPPAYLRTVSIGDEFTVQWKIRNVSRKKYGTESNPSRLCGTRLHKTGSFSFKTPVENDESLQYIDIIDPAGEVAFNQIFRVADSAEPFSRGMMYLEMLLGEPSNDPSRYSPAPSPMPGVRWIARFDLGFQISSAYHYNPEASYLLLVNTNTPGSLVREIIAYVHGSLYLGVDVYNLSVSGTLVEKNTNENILKRYWGKTIIILANQMDYFGQLGRHAYEFIDPWLASRLLKAGTKILFLGLGDVNHLGQNWVKMAATPEFPIDLSGTDGSIHVADINSLLGSFRQMDLSNKRSMEMKSHTVAVKKSMFQSYKSSTDRSGKKLAKRLSKIYPFQNYALAGDHANASKTNPAKVIVREGLSSDITILASSIPCHQDMISLPSPFAYLIAATLPLERRLQMLWTGASDPEGANSNRSPQVINNQGGSSDVDLLQLSENVRRFLALSVKYDLLQETASFCSKAPLRDPASKLSTNILLPSLSTFFSSAKTASIDVNNLPSDKEWLRSIIIWLLAEANPKLFGRARGRKRIVRNFINSNISSTLSPSRPDDTSQSFKSITKQQLPQVQKAIKDLRRSKKGLDELPVVAATMVEIAGAVGIDNTGYPFQDIGRLINRFNPTFFWAEDHHAGFLVAYSAFTQRIAADEARSADMIRNMIVDGA